METERMIPVDGHVHLHNPVQAERSLDAAAENFRKISNHSSQCLGALLLTEARGERVFETLRKNRGCGHWSIQPAVSESQSLLAKRDGHWMAVVCGRQIRCERGLEVTALGTTDEFPDGRPIEETIPQVLDSGALLSLPWGFGKWTGHRGRIVRDVLGRFPRDAIALCDNGARLEMLGRPSLIREAARRGNKILPGTDPFPIGGDYLRTGAFGFLLEGELRPGHPWSDLRAVLQQHRESPRPYGKALGPVRFLVNNVGIQVLNFRRRHQA